MSNEESTEADLTTELEQLLKRKQELIDKNVAEEEQIHKKIAEAKIAKEKLKKTIIALDKELANLSLIHSQVKAASNYRLAKSDVDEMVSRVVK